MSLNEWGTPRGDPLFGPFRYKFLAPLLAVIVLNLHFYFDKLDRHTSYALHDTV